MAPLGLQRLRAEKVVVVVVLVMVLVVGSSFEPLRLRLRVAFHLACAKTLV